MSRSRWRCSPASTSNRLFSDCPQMIRLIRIHADADDGCSTAAVTDCLTALVSPKLLISKLTVAVEQSAFFTPSTLRKTTNGSSSLTPPGFQSGTKVCNHRTGMKSSLSETLPSPQTVATPPPPTHTHTKIPSCGRCESLSAFLI